jgi:hypothetical protein
MLKQGELAFTKAMSKTELSSVFLRELRKAMAAAKKKKALGPPRPMLRAPRPSRKIAESGARLRPPANFRSPRGKLKISPVRSARLSQAGPPCARGSVRGRARGPGPHGRTSCPEQPATRSDRGWACVCRDGSWLHWLTTAKWDAQVPSQGLRPS